MYFPGRSWYFLCIVRQEIKKPFLNLDKLGRAYFHLPLERAGKILLFYYWTLTLYLFSQSLMGAKILSRPFSNLASAFSGSTS